MKILLSLIMITFAISASAVETRGILESLEGPSIIVGESYPYRLTLLPFEERLLKKSDLQGKLLFNLFYVAEVKSQKVSKNNYDAIEINLDLVLVKKAELRSVYIWNLGDRNIPIEIERLSVNDVKLNTKNFLLLKTPSVAFDEQNYLLIGFVILLLVILVLTPFFLMKKKRKDLSPLQDYSKLLSEVKSHKDLELIYINRREILSQMQSSDIKKDFQETIASFETTQYAPGWKEVDISEYKEKFFSIGKELTRGV